MLRDQEGGKVSKRAAHVPDEQDRRQIMTSGGRLLFLVLKNIQIYIIIFVYFDY